MKLNTENMKNSKRNKFSGESKFIFKFKFEFFSEYIVAIDIVSGIIHRKYCHILTDKNVLTCVWS